MRDAFENEVSIGSVDFIQTDMRIENLHVPPLADELLEQRHHRALAEIVGIFLKSQSYHADPLGRQIKNGFDGALQMLFIAREGGLKERKLQIQLAGPVR